jgi:hypothetical protein
MPRKTTKKKPARRAAAGRKGARSRAAAKKGASVRAPAKKGARARKAAPRRGKAPAERRSEVQRVLEREPLETPQLADRAAEEYDGLEQT